MKFQPKWTKDQIEAAREIVARYPTRREGFIAAADFLDTTSDAIRSIFERERAKASKPKAPVPPSDVLSAHMKEVADKAERARVRNLERDLYSLREAMGAMSDLTSRPLEPVRRHEISSGLREATAVALLSDVHAEEHVRAGETPVGNEYSPEIAETSLARFFGGYRWLIDFHRERFDIRDVVLWLGGDLMSGHIHEELKETTEGTPIETLLWIRSRLVGGIDLLLDDPLTERLLIPCSYGNHGRNTPKSFRARGAAHSYEWLLYQWLAAHYENEPRVSFLADASAHQYMRVYDFDLHFHHGDEANYQGGVGGITIPLNKAVAQWDIARKCHYHNFGHWHQYIDTGRVAVNGSVIGYNAYAMSIKATPEPPQQSFYLIDSKRGKTCKSPIWVRESGS